MTAPLFRLATGAALAALVLSPASARAPGKGRSPAYGPVAAATLVSAKGSAVGVVVLRGEKGKAMLDVTLAGVAPGVHGLHLHTTGSCASTTAAAFAGAGGHLNPAMHEHGTDNPKGSHMGDLPNVTVAADGTAQATIPLGTANADLVKAVFDADGTAVVLHAAADDYRTDPTGNSGGRIACGVLRASGE